MLFRSFPRKLDGLGAASLRLSWSLVGRAPNPMLLITAFLWHEGSGGQVRVVIFVKLDKPNAENEIRARFEISHCTPGTGAVATTTQIVYLLPSTISESQTPFY